LFVVCPSRISTHSVSEKKNKRVLSPLPHLLSLPPSLSFLSFSLVPLLLPSPSSCSVVSSFANEDDKTALSAPRGAPRRSKWRWQRYSRVAPLASSCAIRCGPARNFYTPLSFADPFADAIKGSDDDVQDGLVHIRIQQRNGRKTLTTVQGLSSEYDLKKIVRACKKVSERLSLWRSPPILSPIHQPIYPLHLFPSLSYCASHSVLSLTHYSVRQNSKNRSDANNRKQYIANRYSFANSLRK